MAILLSDFPGSCPMASSEMGSSIPSLSLPNHWERAGDHCDLIRLIIRDKMNVGQLIIIASIPCIMIYLTNFLFHGYK